MKLTMYQVGAFASSTFRGDPAAIIALDNWFEDGWLQDIASENNLAETAYMIGHGGGILPQARNSIYVVMPPWSRLLWH